MAPAVPIVKIARYSDVLGVRSPDCEAHAANSLNFDHVRPHRFVRLVKRALRVKMQIEVADQGWKAVRIVELSLAAVFGGCAEAIRGDLSGQRRNEKAFRVLAGHRHGSVREHDRCRPGLRQKCSNLPARLCSPFASTVRSQDPERVAVISPDDCFYFLSSHASL